MSSFLRLRTKKVCVVFIVLFVLFSSCSVARHTIDEQQMAPYFIYTSLEGERYSVSELYRSDKSPGIQEVLIVFWSMHCRLSRRYVNRIRDAMPQDSETLAVLMVNLDAYEELGKLREYIVEHNLGGFHHAFSGTRENDDTYVSFGSPAFPVSYVLNYERRIVGVYK